MRVAIGTPKTKREKQREAGPHANARRITASLDPRNREGHGDRSAECLMRKTLQERVRRRCQLHDKGLAWKGSPLPLPLPFFLHSFSLVLTSPPPSPSVYPVLPPVSTFSLSILHPCSFLFFLFLCSFFIYLLPPSFLFSLFILFLLSTLFFHPYTTSNYCSLAFIPTPPLHPSSFRLVLPASPPSSPFPLPLPHPPPRSPHPSASVREERRKRLARNAIYSASRKQ